jgi:hypothetical protein
MGILGDWADNELEILRDNYVYVDTDETMAWTNIAYTVQKAMYPEYGLYNLQHASIRRMTDIVYRLLPAPYYTQFVDGIVWTGFSKL